MLNILILGGSTEGFALAERLRGRAARVTTSLAGLTRERREPAGRLRLGGFGGAAGLAAHLAAERIDVLIDATHPFARTITENAILAAERAGVPLLRVERPAWTPQPGERWIDAADLADAAQAIPAGASPVFLAIGRTGLRAFAARSDLAFIARMIEPPEEDSGIAALDFVFARGPFEEAAERAFLTGRGVRCLVSKNSGGAAARAKLDAARALGLPVVMVRRPPSPPGGERVADADGALSWLERRCGLG